MGAIAGDDGATRSQGAVDRVRALVYDVASIRYPDIAGSPHLDQPDGVTGSQENTMARKTLIDAPEKPAVKTAKAPVKAPKSIAYLVTYSRDDGEQHTIPVEAANGPEATKLVETNMPGCEIHSCVIDTEKEQRPALSSGSGREARPDPKPSPVKPNRGGTRAVSAGVAEKAKPALKGKTSSAVAKADKAAATKPAAKKAEKTTAPDPRPGAVVDNVESANRAKAKSDLQGEVVKLWNASKEKDAGARRKAIAKQLKIPGRVMGILRDAGIDGKKTS